MRTEERLLYRLHSQTPPYRARVAQTLRIIRRYAAGAYVSTSWGKDSVVLVHLARRVRPEITCLHMASPAEMPGTEDVADWYREQGAHVVTLPARDLAEYLAWLREVRLPHERTASEQARVVQGLKKDRADAWALEHGYETAIMGLRAEESRARRRLRQYRGLTQRTRAGLRHVYPLLDWTARDVWAYIVEHGLPYLPLYDRQTHGQTRETLRNAGWLSTDGAERGRIAWLRHHYPRLYQRLVEEFPGARAWA